MEAIKRREQAIKQMDDEIRRTKAKIADIQNENNISMQPTLEGGR